MSVRLASAYTAQVESQESEWLTLQRIHHLRLLLVQFYPERCELFVETLQGTLCPAAFRMVAADGDDDIIGEPVIINGLVGPLGRLTADRVERPVNVVQVDIRCQWAERAALRNANTAPTLIICLTRCKTRESWTRFAILSSSTECRIVSKYRDRSTSITVNIRRCTLRLTSARAR